MTANSNELTINGLDHYSFYEFLSESEIDLIRKHSNIVVYQKSNNIFLQKTLTSHIMFIKSGLVKIYKESKSGRSVILKLEVADNFLGLMSVFGREIHEFSASAVEQTEIFFIDLVTFKQILESNGTFAVQMLQQVCGTGLFMFDRLMAQTYKQLPGRIADVLLYFSEEIYKSTKFYFPFTRRELAELAGTTKESFIRTLTEFKNDKIIDLNGSEVDIKSMKIVKTLSEFG